MSSPRNALGGRIRLAFALHAVLFGATIARAADVKSKPGAKQVTAPPSSAKAALLAPDIWVEAFPPGNNRPKAKFHIWNTGKSGSGPFQVTFTCHKVCGGPNSGQPCTIKPMPVTNIEPDKVDIRLFPEGALASKCHHSITVILDAANAVAESNEANNSDAMQW